LKTIYKSIIFLLCLIALVALSYYLQPIKKGAGSNTAIHYKLLANWPSLPKGMHLGNPVGLGMDTNQNVVLFHRAGRTWPLLGSMPGERIQEATILVIGKDSGNLVSSWGQDLFIMPHGLTVDKENNIWVTDVGLHQVFKFTHDGKLLLKLGKPKEAGGDSIHFDKPTDVAIAKDGSFYVSDGYGNSRVVKFSAKGIYLFEWGISGTAQGEFDIPHSITLDGNDNVYVADRENNRIQVFNRDGKFIRQFYGNNFGSICAVAFDTPSSRLFAADDFTYLKVKHRGSDVFVFDSSGNIHTRFGRSGSYAGSTCWYHDLAVDKDQNIYVGDILGNRLQKFEKVSHR
jgi:peptidylamidoglycolate lyase